jgi:hypothetical protein
MSKSNKKGCAACDTRDARIEGMERAIIRIEDLLEQVADAVAVPFIRKQSLVERAVARWNNLLDKAGVKR